MPAARSVFGPESTGAEQPAASARTATRARSPSDPGRRRPRLDPGLRPRPCRPHQRDLDHEPGAGADGVVLDPHPSAVEPDVLRHQRQAEARPLPAAPALAGGRTPEEALEDGLPLPGGHAGPLVVDRHPGHVVAGVDDHPGGPAAVAGGVLDQVLDDLRRSAACRPGWPGRRPRSGPELHRRASDGGHGPGDELGQADVVQVQVGHAGVVAGDLQQVLHQPLEALHVGGEQVERRPGTARAARRAARPAPRPWWPAS